MEKNHAEKAWSFWYLGAALALVAFLACVVGLSEVQTAWLRFGVLTPSLLALIFVSCFDRSWQSPFLRQFLLSARAMPWLVVSLACFPVLALMMTAIGHYVFDSPFRLGHFPQVNTILLILFLSLGEEAGWRGYALPRLAERIGWKWATVVVGLVWWLWHTPGWLLGFGAPNDISFAVFGLWVVSAAFLFTYIYMRSGGNVWTAVLLHASANLSFQVFPVMPGSAGGVQNFYLLCAMTVLLAVLVWLRLASVGEPHCR